LTVKLVSYSMASKEMFNADSSLRDLQGLVSYCARVSNPSNQMNSETSERLIKYLIEHKHWSPLEMVNVCLEINTTRDIAHQIVRHRSFSFQEFSQRYAEPKEIGDQFVIREARLQDTKNRQNSVETTDHELISEWKTLQEDIISHAQRVYEWAIKNGIAKEQARVVLPEGLTKTRLYMNGTLRSWVHYIELRGENGTQKEHMDIAHACAKVITEIFPLAKNITV